MIVHHVRQSFLSLSLLAAIAVPCLTMPTVRGEDATADELAKTISSANGKLNAIRNKYKKENPEVGALYAKRAELEAQIKELNTAIDEKIAGTDTEFATLQKQMADAQAKRNEVAEAAKAAAMAKKAEAAAAAKAAKAEKAAKPK